MSARHLAHQHVTPRVRLVSTDAPKVTLPSDSPWLVARDVVLIVATGTAILWFALSIAMALP